MKKILLAVEILSIVVAAVFGLMWAIDPNGPYEPITFLSLLIGGTVVDLARRLLPHKQIEFNTASQSESYIAIDGSNYPGGNMALKSISYDPRIKVWELLELIEEYFPQAVPAEYDKSWVLRYAHGGGNVNGLGAYIREKGYLEEEARTIQHIGIGPNTTLQITKIGR